MRIAEIPQMAEITVKMVHNNSQCCVKTRVLTSYGEGILVTPLHCSEGEVVEYCSKAWIEYTEPATGLKHIFESDSVARTDFNGTGEKRLSCPTGKEKPKDTWYRSWDRQLLITGRP